jgi:hypothetical protein
MLTSLIQTPTTIRCIKGHAVILSIMAFASDAAPLRTELTGAFDWPGGGCRSADSVRHTGPVAQR